MDVAYSCVHVNHTSSISMIIIGSQTCTHVIPPPSYENTYTHSCTAKNMLLYSIYSHNITSGKNFIKITSVGMGAAKSNETR